MIEFVTRLVQPILQIRRNEWPKALSMFIYFSCTIATLYILKPIRSSLFLTSHGADQLRYAYIGEGAFLLFFTFAYIHLSGQFASRRNLFFAATIFFISNIILFWALFHFHIYTESLAFLFYIWVAAYSITIVTQFWTLANDIFDPREAKRLFGFILSGGSLGGVVGGILTNQMAERIGTENLLLIVAFLLSTSIFLIYMVTRHESPKTISLRKPKSDEIARLQDKSTWKIFFNSRYLLLLVALVMISKLVSTLIDNQFNSVVENTILEKNTRTAFFGGFLAWLNAVSFLLQLVAASYILRHAGVALSLLLLPLGLALGAAGTLLFHTLAASIILRTYDGSMNYSIGQLGKEILYIPIPSSIRYRVKPIIDMLGFRLSKSVAGIFIIFMTTLLGIPDEKLGIIVLFVVPLWIMAVWGVRDEYMRAIKKLISEPEENIPMTTQVPEKVQDVIQHLSNENACEKLKPLLIHPSSIARKTAAIACISAAFSSTTADLVRHIAEYESINLKHVDLNELNEPGFFNPEGNFGNFLSRWMEKHKSDTRLFQTLLLAQESEWLLVLSEAISDPKEDIKNRRIAVLMLAAMGSQGAVDVLLNQLSLIKDQSLRFNIIRALDRIQVSGEKRQFSSWILRKGILFEAEDARINQAMILLCRHKIALSEELRPYLITLFETLRDEGLERLFRLLSILYSRDIILVIYKRLTDYHATAAFKAHALELLENVVEPKLARAIASIYEEEVAFEWREAAKRMEQLKHFHDPWSLMSAAVLIRYLKPSKADRELELMKHSSFPLVREIAEALARHP